MYMPGFSYSVSNCKSITSFACHQHRTLLYSPKMACTVQQLSRRFGLRHSSIFFLLMSTEMSYSIHWALGENKKIESRQCIPLFHMASFSKLFISKNKCLLFITDKSMFSSRHHKTPIIKSPLPTFSVFSLTQILVVPCWPADRRT